MMSSARIDWGALSAPEVEMLQAIHLAICAELDIDLGHHAAREAVAHAIIAIAANGNRDVPVIEDAARAAGIRAITTS